MSILLNTIIFFLFLNVNIQEKIAVTADYKYEIGEFQEAVGEYVKLENDSYNSLNLIDSLYQLGKFSQAKLASNRFKLKFINTSDYYFLLGIEEMRKSNLKNAEKLFRKSLKKNRENHRVRVELAISYLKLKKYNEMEIEIEELLGNKDNYSEILYIYGLFYRLQGKYSEAEKYFEASLIFSPNDIYVNAEIYRNKIVQRKKINSSYYFKKNQKFYMRFVIEALKEILNKDGNLKAIIKKLRSVKNYDQGVKTMLALCLFSVGKKQESRKISKELLDHYKDVNIVNLSYGIINFDSNSELSKKLLKKAMVPSLYLNDPVLFYLLGESLLKNKEILIELKKKSVIYSNDLKLKYDYDSLMEIMIKN